MSKNKIKLEERESGNGPKIKFTDDFWLMIEKIGEADEENHVAWSLAEIEQNETIKNKIGITTVDICQKPDYFEIITSDGKPGTISVASFLKYYFPKRFTERDINEFLKIYNRVIKGTLTTPINKPETNAVPTSKTLGYHDDYDDLDAETYGVGAWGGAYGDGSWGVSYRKPISKGEIVTVPDFKFNPKDVRSTFLSLTTKTYPNPNEDEVVKFLPKDLKKDEWGNYYKVIGESDTMFTSHLDTADRTQKNVTVLSYNEDGDEIFVTDGTSILGADDKAGVTVLLYMMAHNVPGVYYFFIGEEVGALGSRPVADNMDRIEHLRGIKKCVSFDRRNYHSVITSQRGGVCCSDKFATSLAAELNKSGLNMRLDNGGVFTDSASFMDLIPECTNVSVGYFSEHTHSEKQNISFLERLAKACVKVEWGSLTVARKVGIDPEVGAKFSTMLMDIRKARIYNGKKFYSDEGKLYVTMDVDDSSITRLKMDIDDLKKIFDKHDRDPDVLFDSGMIKFEFE